MSNREQTDLPGAHQPVRCTCLGILEGRRKKRRHLTLHKSTRAAPKIYQLKVSKASEKAGEVSDNAV